MDLDDELPDLFLLEEYEGNWDKYFHEIYSQFEKDFILSKPTWALGKPVHLKKHPEYDGKSATFWHMISEGSDEQERTPDIRRCERIAWVRFLMEKVTSRTPKEGDPIVWWVEKRGSENRYHIALSDFSYLVVVADRDGYVLPWTAFHIEYKNQREKRKKKFLAYWDAQKS